jgi:RNA polymerase sigma-70 factor (ECF subfamily)
VLTDQLVKRAATDDAVAFAAFARRQLDASYRLAAVILGDPTDAQDATHDAFVSAWRGWSTLRDPDKVDAWFGRILVNSCRSHLRRRRRRPQVIDVSDSIELPAVGDHAADSADRDALARGFARLDADRRLCIALRYYADLTVPQIAARTGWPEGTVKSRLHHALRDLRVTVDDASLEDER